MDIGDRIKQLRKEKGLSQAKVAKEISVSTGNFGDWETGRTGPSVNAVLSIAKYFEVNLEWLLTGKYVDNEFTKEETQLINKIRELDTRDKEELNNIVNYKYKIMLEKINP